MAKNHKERTSIFIGGWCVVFENLEWTLCSKLLGNTGIDIPVDITILYYFCRRTRDHGVCLSNK